MSIRALLIFVFTTSRSLDAFKIDRVILATDSNPTYIQFWPIVAKAWSKIVGVRPTLALIAGPEIKVDETIGDVIRFDPIPGVPNSMYAQAIRLLLPALFERDVCIMADIDMVPLSKKYFIDSVKYIALDKFVVYKDKAYPDGYGQFPMCYNAARGSVFKEIFGVRDIHDIPELIKAWHALGYGWNTDERVLYATLLNWKDYTTRCIKLGHTVKRRIDRLAWGYNKKLVKKGYYVDAHCRRPYSQYKKEIDQLVRDAGLKI